MKVKTDNGEMLEKYEHNKEKVLNVIQRIIEASIYDYSLRIDLTKEVE